MMNPYRTNAQLDALNTADMDSAMAMQSMNWLSLYTKASDHVNDWFGRMWQQVRRRTVDSFDYIVAIGESLDMPEFVSDTDETKVSNFTTVMCLISHHVKVPYTRSEVAALRWMLSRGYELPEMDALADALEEVIS